MQSTSYLTRSDGFLLLLLLLLLLPVPWQQASVTHARVNPMRGTTLDYTTDYIDIVWYCKSMSQKMGNTCALHHTHAQMELLFTVRRSCRCIWLQCIRAACYPVTQHISSYSITSLCIHFSWTTLRRPYRFDSLCSLLVMRRIPCPWRFLTTHF